jgi:serine/threonine protein kinase
MLGNLQNPKGYTYHLVSVVGAGGGGDVYLALGEDGRELAIKILKPNPHNRLVGVETWWNECSLAMKCLEHPNIVQIVDYFQTYQGHLVIVMERANCSLADLLIQGYKFNVKAVCSVGMDVLNALDYIHSLPVTHRDVTPKNILVFPDWVYKISDFGIAKTTVSAEELASTFIGYQSYLPPELVRHGYSRQQSDFYQLGIVLLTLMTGRPPIDETLTQQQATEQILAGVPRQQAEALAQSGDAYRYRTTAEIQSELTRVANLQPA